MDGAGNHYSAYLLVTFDCDVLRYSKGDLCASQSSPRHNQVFFNNKFNTFFGLNLTLVYTFPMCMTWRFHFPLRNYDFKTTVHIQITVVFTRLGRFHPVIHPAGARRQRLASAGATCQHAGPTNQCRYGVGIPGLRITR